MDPVSTKPFLRGGELFYETMAGGQRKELRADQVFHIKGLSYDGLVGHDVLTVMSDPLGLALADRKFGGKFFANGMHVGGFLQVPPGLSDKAKERVNADMKKRGEGLDNAFRKMLLEDGVKFIQTTIDPEKAQLLESRQWDVIEIANILGLPPHKLGSSDRMAYNSLEQENKSTLEDGYGPWLSIWEEEADAKLLDEEELRADTHYFEFDRRSLQAVDSETQQTTGTGYANGGIMLVDEVRAEMNLPPLPNGEGQKLRIPTTITIAGEEPVEPDPADPTEIIQADDTDNAGRMNKARDAGRALVLSVLDRFAKISADNCVKQASAKGNFTDWCEKWFIQQEERLASALSPCYAVTGALDMPGTADNTAKNWALRAKDVVLGCTNVTPDKLAGTLETAFADAAKWEFESLLETP